MKVKLRDNVYNEDIELDDSALPMALKDDRFSVYPGQQFEFEDQSGQRKIVPSEQIFDAIDAGYKYIDSTKQAKEQALLEAGEKPFQAAAVAGLSGLTLGVSDVALKETGLFSDEELRNLREANPTISTASEIAGSVAPMFLTSGTGLAAQVASKTPAALALKTGDIISEGLALSGAFAKAAKSDVVKTALKVGAGSAVEGSLFGAGKLLSEEALGNAEFNAENLFS